jgi:hypothetical protein
MRVAQEMCESLSGVCVPLHNPERAPCDPKNCAVVKFAEMLFQAGRDSVPTSEALF